MDPMYPAGAPTAPPLPSPSSPIPVFTRRLRDVSSLDTPDVGGKASSLGEMLQALVARGVRVPEGFVTTTAAWRVFLDAPCPRDTWDGLPLPAGAEEVARSAGTRGSLREAIASIFSGALAEDGLDLHARTALARAFVLQTPLPPEVDAAIREGYEDLCRRYGPEVDTAVRSSATKEDSAMASFAGQYESYLNIQGTQAVLDAWHRCAASAFTERAVSYQLDQKMDLLDGGLAVVIMKMVRSDLATSGVMFTLDPDSGNRNVIHVSSSYGLGELVVQGAVSPDSFVVWKEGLRRGRDAVVHRTMGAKDRKLVYRTQGGTTTESVDVQASWRREWSLTNAEVLELARMGMEIEEHYGRPMDIEWAKDGYSGELFIVQARPETVHGPVEHLDILETYRMDAAISDRLKREGKVLLRGHSVGTRIGAGPVRVYDSYEEVILRKRDLRKRVKEGLALDTLAPEDRVFDPGDVLVTELTTPDWEPLMKEASLIITEKGGRTSHAAIVAREFGIPAIVGCEDATRILRNLQEVTGSCAEGDAGIVYDGIQPFEVEKMEVDRTRSLRTRVKVNVGFPDRALREARLPSDGVGLARIEFILTAEVGVHPLALRFYEELKVFADRGDVDPSLEPYRERLEREGPEEIRTVLGAIERRTPGYDDRRHFFVDQLADGVALICAAFHPRPVLVRLSDLKSNEYRDLLGGRFFEPEEENPMIAWRGASRYVDPRFRPAFEMECEALARVRWGMGLDNLQVMVPFCRSPEEGAEVARLLDARRLSPRAGVPLFLMIELPSNVLEADRFISEMGLTGGSIGSNDLVQTVYAVSRDDLEHYTHPVDARSPSVKIMIKEAIRAFNAAGLEIGICGQAPSDHPDEVPSFLVEAGITSISVTPDTLLKLRIAVDAAEQKRKVVGG